MFQNIINIWYVIKEWQKNKFKYYSYLYIILVRIYSLNNKGIKQLLRIKYSEEIEKQMKAFFDTLNEKDRRRYAAIEAMKLGHGGQKYVSSVLGCHFQTVMAGTDEITNGTKTPEERIRKPGGGRKKVIETEENIDEVFFEILINHTAGSPIDNKVKWTNLSLKEISKAFETKSMNITPYVA